MKTRSEEEILGQILKELSQIDNDARSRIINSALALYGLNGRPQPASESGHLKHPVGGNGREPVFSNHKDIDSKTFITRKEPQTDIDRVACLAYYLTHYQDIKHFKTIDITKLNTDAAQRKFANAAQAVDNATTRGYLVSATKGHKQIAAFGEQYVDVLPDQELAKSIREKNKLRRAKRKKKPARKK